MATKKIAYAITISLVSLLLFPLLVDFVNAEKVPDWVKNIALWYGEGTVSENEFLNTIKFLIENKIIVLDTADKTLESSKPKNQVTNVVIPNGNANISSGSFFIPLNAEIEVGTTVVWINDDVVLHTIQSQDEKGKIIGLFNSPPLDVGERFAYKFDKAGVYHYFCSIHPWRVGLVTVS